MTWAAPIGADLARSLVLGLGADCSTAAALARAMAGRQGHAIDVHNLADWPAAAIHRVTSDFVIRGWLSHTIPVGRSGRDRSHLDLRRSSTALPRCEQSCRMKAWQPPS